MRIFRRACLGVGLGLVMAFGASAADGVVDTVKEQSKSVAGLLTAPFKVFKKDPPPPSYGQPGPYSIPMHGDYDESRPTSRSSGRAPSGGGDIGSRTMTDDYGPVHRPTAQPRRRTAPAASAARRGLYAPDSALESETLGSSANHPTSHDAAIIGSSLDEEVRRLEARERMEWDRLNKYQEKYHELAKLIKEYEQRHRATQRQVANFRRVRDLISADPSIITQPDGVNRALAENGIALGAPVPATEDDLLSGGDSDWAVHGGDSPEPFEMNGAATEWAPSSTPSESSIAAPPGMAPPPAAGGMDDAWGVAPSNMGKAIQPKDENPFETPEIKPAEERLVASVLAKDEGGDVILGLGSREGIKRGMTFAIGGGDDRTVLVVTDAYPTYARAMPHPKYCAREVQIRDRVEEIPQILVND